MSRSIPVFGLIIFVLSSCGGGGSNDNMSQSEEKTAEAALYGEVIEIHDLVMPKMKEINELGDRLDKKIEALQEEKDNDQISNDDLVLLDQLTSTKEELEAADSEMMNWMRGFEPITDELEHQAVMDKLNEEKEKIEQVKMKIDDALSRAESVISEAGI